MAALLLTTQAWAAAAHSELTRLSVGDMSFSAMLQPGRSLAVRWRGESYAAQNTSMPPPSTSAGPSGGSTPQSTNRPLVEFLTSYRTPEQRDSPWEHAAISAAQRQARSPGQPVPRPSALAQSLLQVNEAARQRAAQEREDGPGRPGGALEAFEA
jgi:hypothetical protein